MTSVNHDKYDKPLKESSYPLDFPSFSKWRYIVAILLPNNPNRSWWTLKNLRPPIFDQPFCIFPHQHLLMSPDVTRVPPGSHPVQFVEAVQLLLGGRQELPRNLSGAPGPAEFMRMFFDVLMGLDGLVFERSSRTWKIWCIQYKFKDNIFQVLPISSLHLGCLTRGNRTSVHLWNRETSCFCKVAAASNMAIRTPQRRIHLQTVSPFKENLWFLTQFSVPCLAMSWRGHLAIPVPCLQSGCALFWTHSSLAAKSWGLGGFGRSWAVLGH